MKLKYKHTFYKNETFKIKCTFKLVFTSQFNTSEKNLLTTTNDYCQSKVPFKPNSQIKFKFTTFFYNQ